MHHNHINIAGIRKDYRQAELDEVVVGDEPLHFFSKWFAEAHKAEIDDVNAMTLATVDSKHKPHARIVLLKGLDEKGFVFFTNYNSAKGREIETNTHAAVCFFWKELERQVRIEGIMEKISAAESDQYFDSRPEGSKLGAWSSPQSDVIANRQVLENNQKQFEEQYSGKPIPRPSHWGGYRLIPEVIEFWQGRTSRLHDRILFTKQGNGWKKERLAP